MIELVFDCKEEDTAVAMYHALRAAFFKSNHGHFTHLGQDKYLVQIVLDNHTSAIDIDLRINIEDCKLTVLGADEDRFLRASETKKKEDG